MTDLAAAIAEATTVKHRARTLLRDIEALLADKGLTEEQTKPLRALHDKLKGKWSDLTAPEPTAESVAVEAAAILAQDDSYDGRRCAVQAALWRAVAASGGMMGEGPYPWIRDLYDDVVVYQLGSDLYRSDYTINDDESVTLGPPVEVQVAYVPAPDADDADLPTTAVTVSTEAKADPTVGGGTDRSKIPAADFAGKNRSYPIVTPQDVADAASSIGRAGADNYSADELKTRIIRIAKRKGATFVAKLPKAWRDGMGEADDPRNLGQVVTEAEIVGDIVPLIEKAVKKDGSMMIKVIQPGWGASGYYPEEVLKRDGPKVFTKGMHMFWNHQTAEESDARPEGDLRDLAGVLTADAAWKDTGPAGKGLYAPAKAVETYHASIENLAPYIGTSIRSWGRAVEGEAEGRAGQIIQELTAGRSVDFVTRAGAGGEIVQLFEAARGRAVSPPTERSSTVDEEQARALREANTGLERRVAEMEQTIARQQEGILLRDAREFLATALRSIDMPEITRARLGESLLPKAPLKDGALDREAYGTLIRETVKGELAYLGQATGLGDGRIRGMGASTSSDDPKAATESLAEALGQLGNLSNEHALVAANGRR